MGIKTKEYIIRIPGDVYTKDMKRMFDFLRYKKATKTSKASSKKIDELVDAVRKSRKEPKQALRYL
ncbi:MAG: hypothetical protein K2X48_01470 [Chitinophagaceae bacterium]|nr:hypothetical protein [Chitinophagaceae bacterium]